MDRHQLQVCAGFDVGPREKAADVFGELPLVRDAQAVLRFFQEIQVGRGVFELRPVLQACRATQCGPDAFHQPAKGQPAPLVEGVAEDGNHAINARQTVGRQPFLPLGVPKQVPDGPRGFAAGQRLEVREREPAPWRPQDRQPGQAVARVHERLGERHQVLHHRTLAQGVDLHGAELPPVPMERGDDAEEVIAGQDQHGDGLLRPLRLDLVDDLDDTVGLGFGIRSKERMYAHVTVGIVVLERLGGFVRHRPGEYVFGVGERLAHCAVHPSHDGREGTEIHRQREGVQPDGADPVRPGLQEESHLRLAEAVDRLHRIADQEQRPAVSGLPVPDEPAEQVILALGGVLELVDQQMPDLAVKGMGQVGWRRVRPQGGSRADRDLREIHAPFFLEYPPELIDGQRQQEHQGVQDFPLRLLETRQGQGSQRVQGSDGGVVQFDVGEPRFGVASGGVCGESFLY